jgi:hypothetical protein
MSTLRSIVYVSTVVGSFDTDALEALLVDARAFNTENAITGVLLHSNQHFMQCLEGPEEAVQRAYERIRASRRHSDLVEYMNGLIQARSFPDWAMGSTTPTPSELLKLSNARWDQIRGEAKFPPSLPLGLDMLRVFWNMRLIEPPRRVFVGGRYRD